MLLKLLQQMRLERGHKEWQETCYRLQQDRTKCRAKATGGRRTRKNIQWPNHLAIDIPPFANWLLNVVRMQTTNGVEVDLDVLCCSCPPNCIAYT
jgi:hypothetical protein